MLGLQDQREAMIRACNTFGHIKQPPKNGIMTSEASNSTCLLNGSPRVELKRLHKVFKLLRILLNTKLPGVNNMIVYVNKKDAMLAILFR